MKTEFSMRYLNCAVTESVVGGSTDGTCSWAKAALDASVGIDFVFAVTLGN